VIPYKALGLIIYLKFAKVMEDFAEQKTRKEYLGLVWFGLNFFEIK